MADRQVINTGPLVTLARADLLELLGKLPGEFVCPQEVMREINAGLGKGYPNAKPEWVRTIALKEPLSVIALMTLDVGEAAVIQSALEQVVQDVLNSVGEQKLS